jgi:hypothetical protein
MPPLPHMVIHHPMPTQAHIPNQMPAPTPMAMAVVRQHMLRQRRMQHRHPPRIRLIHRPPLDPVHLAAPITHSPGQLGRHQPSQKPGLVYTCE